MSTDKKRHRSRKKKGLNPGCVMCHKAQHARGNSLSNGFSGTTKLKKLLIMRDRVNDSSKGIEKEG